MLDHGGLYRDPHGLMQFEQPGNLDCDFQPKRSSKILLGQFSSFKIETNGEISTPVLCNNWPFVHRQRIEWPLSNSSPYTQWPESKNVAKRHL